MRTELFDYELPEELVAQHPPPERDGGRMLVLGSELEHAQVRELAERIPAGALLVLNDTRVLCARLLGQRDSGGSTELLLSRHRGTSEDGQRWLALGRPHKRLRPGTEVHFGALTARVLERLDGGRLEVLLTADGDVDAALERVGHVPLPPYVRRPDDAADRERYQTVYAERQGSVAAPTAGLHLTEAMLARLAERDVRVAKTTLHVGAGTFKPVTADDLDQHDMHSEWLEVGPELASAIADARRRGAPVVAIGTTVVRALESARDPARPGHVTPFAGETRLLIQPGYAFSVVDALLTNFHMPKSTLIALVAAFAGLDRVRSAYAEAVRRRYRFLSYGDAMWIPERAS
ncbi:MAG: tRNA preQ1(34) S-adenosylmethionine ribosyltransferase-isomerase QueA [Myxococcales bacterium]|nr:tRNA preQ1(34) S-adenosylmethionine ribosyltransferase-isomerase QueA [Myxococcales bacterium]MCB9577658.1 tRNA preQ1(34) S-adenosylmethionine ribosyltransferase-isomerase QueA [Polyangiaceae bacterium]